MPDPRPSRRRPRALAALAMVVALVAFPLGALASHQYGDVPDSNPFHGDIAAITDAGITSGCGGGNYCPDRNVTRAEMAAFMNRLGALSTGKTPVVNAAQTDGWSLGCPSGTTYSQGLCFEQTNRAAQNVYAAADTCAGLGGLFGQIYRWRLPTIHQLRSARDAYLITLDASGEHTDSLHDFWNGSSSQTNSWTVFEGGTLGDVVGGTTRKFRCVTSPYSYNLSFIILSQQNQYPAPQPYRPAGVDAQGLVTE